MNHQTPYRSSAVVFFSVVGSMISLGIFVLPAVAYHEIGSAILIAYLLSSLLMIPTALSMAELGTAMPDEGGAYFYVGRSMGQMLGFFAGLANWLTLGLKGAFALGSIGVLIKLFWPNTSSWHLRLVLLLALFLLLLFEVLAEGRTDKMYAIATGLVIFGVMVYVVTSASRLNLQYVQSGAKGGLIEILKVTGMISVAYYEGLIKIAMLSAKLKSPGKSVPRLIFGSFFVVAMFYLGVIFLTLSNLSPAEFSSSMLPVATVAAKFFGKAGLWITSALALIAFLVSASLSMVGAAHVPQAMARDGLLPSWLARENQRGFAINGYLVTTMLMAVAIGFFDIALLVKIASGMLLLLVTLMNLAVIILRESKIVAYRPTYYSPFYPLPQIVGALASLTLIFEIGNGPLLVTLLFFVVFSLLYFLGGKHKGGSDAALRHLVGRVISREVKGEGLDDELTRILQQRDNIQEDRFDQLIRQAIVLDINKPISQTSLFNKLASAVALKTDLSVVDVYHKLLEREKDSTTLLSPTLAIPHVIFDEEGLDFVITVLRCLPGITFNDDATGVNTVFCLAGSPEERNFHLKALMNIAQIVQDPQFQKDWLKARDEEELRYAILLAERQRSSN